MTQALAARLATERRRDLRRAPRPGARVTGPVVVALGGGHGLAATLTALRYVTDEVTAIVTVADDGGSSGRLRDEFGVLPPGDLRMALAALCSESEWGQTWRDVLQHRFAGDGPLGGPRPGQPAHRRPVGAARRPRRRARPRGAAAPGRRAGCCRWRRCRCTIEADVSGLDPDRPGCRADRQRAGARSRSRPARSARCAWCRRTRRPTRSRSRPSAAPTGSCSARARGSPR